jgi:hypothetical protein
MIDVPIPKYRIRPRTLHQNINLMNPQNPHPPSPLRFPSPDEDPPSSLDPFPSLGHAAEWAHSIDSVPGV